MSDATTFPTRIAADDTPNQQAATGSPDAGPVQPRERMVLVDVLRGFALLGIIQINWRLTNAAALPKLQEFFVDGSFFTTFSFLFGLGFAIQIIRAEEAKRPFILRFLWRSLILFFIGAAHFIFIWDGDIVRNYALIGVLLLFVRRLRPGLIIALAAAVLVLSMSPRLAPEWSLLTRINPEQVETERLRVQLQASTVPRPTDPYRQSVSGQAGRVRKQLGQELTVQRWQGGHTEILCMFLLGLYAGRRRFFRDAEKHTRFFIWVAAVALVFGLVGNALDVFRDFFTGKGIALPKALDGWRLAYSLGNIGLSLFYLAGITLLFTHWGRARQVLAPLAHVGRMGLTNYLMQSVILAIILGRGFGLVIGRGGVVEGWSNLILVNALFAVQILYSYWWFRYFQFGPVEWLWRSLTWFRIQPMLIAPRQSPQEESGS